MFYIVPTKRGMGVEVWGTYDDLNILYGIVAKFWNQENFVNKKDFENRDHLVSGFSYELRHAKDGSRLSREHSHYSFEPIKYFGFQVSWVQMLFSLQVLRFNMRYLENDKYDLATFLQIEHELEYAMRSFDEQGARKLVHFITDGIYISNPYLYQVMRSINLDFFQSGGGKAGFRKLPILLRKSVFYTEEYHAYNAFLESEGIKFNCKPEELELMDDKFDYDKVKW